MIIETKTYWVPAYHTPSDEDLDNACELAKSKGCHIDLCWKGPDNKYYGGYHSRFIDPDTDVDELKRSVRSIVYGL